MSQFNYCLVIIALSIALFGVTLSIFVTFFRQITNDTSNSDDFKQINYEINETIVVITDNGVVRGKKVKTLYDEKPYYAFKGIPYGKPPIGELRFKVYCHIICRKNVFYDIKK